MKLDKTARKKPWITVFALVLAGLLLLVAGYIVGTSLGAFLYNITH